jgi:hypothetical protein
MHLMDALAALFSGVRAQYGTPATVLIVVGFLVAMRRDWRSTLVFALAATTALVFSVVYPNESDVGRYRLLVSWLAVPLFGALTPRSPRTLGFALHAALILFLAAGAGLTFEQQQRGFFRHIPREGGRWVIEAVRPYVPRNGTIVTDWLDATSLAYGAYVDRSLPDRVIVSDDKLRINRYRTWAKQRRVFVLVDPRSVDMLPGARDYAKLDEYHELYEVTP